MGNNIYFIPGRDDRLLDDMGQMLLDLGLEFHGREIIPPFSLLRFPDQISRIKNDLKSRLWSPESVLIGDSYGAYLILHSLAELEPFPGRILLFSPVLGSATIATKTFGVRPPRADKLLKLVNANEFPEPGYLEIHTGAEDKDCDPVLAQQFGSLIPDSSVHVVEGQGHRLEEKYIKSVLESYFGLS